MDQLLIDPNEEVSVDQENTQGAETVSAAAFGEALIPFIADFLRINPSPSDDQVHSLAFSIGLTPAALEEAMYQDLAQSNNVESSMGDDNQELLEDYETLNEGDPTDVRPVGDRSTRSDGGVEISPEKELLNDDLAL